MKKPKAKKIERLEYDDCEKYISHKLGYDTRDTLGAFSAEASKNGTWETIEYRDFWHFLCEECDVHNGCEIYMPDPSRAKEAWQKPILEAFIEEFGEGPYWVWW